VKIENSNVLVEAEWLVENLDNPNVVVLEVFMPGASAGGENPGTIPNARRLNWKDFVWESKRREFADPRTLSIRLGELGIPAEAEVVICGDPIQFGTYAYMALTMAGNKNVRVLNGGKVRWLNLNLPISHESPNYSAVERRFVDVDRSIIVGRDEVLTSLGTEEVQILDVRSEEEYLGLRVSPSTSPIDHGAQAWGRIPSAKHLYFGSLLGEDGRFLDPEALVAKFTSAGISLDRPVFLYCRLGHRASMAWFILSEIIGFDLARVYDGSWTEWGSMVGMPIER
jgi:thiosulfate/3-mercaptopyruvate sulfurtransferase